MTFGLAALSASVFAGLDLLRAKEGLNNSPVLGDNSAPRLGR
ncbi:hypothetical protein [Pseudoxanthomonas mexicana]